MARARKAARAKSRRPEPLGWRLVASAFETLFAALGLTEKLRAPRRKRSARLSQKKSRHFAAYARLGLADRAAPEAVKAAYRVLMLAHHPDRHAQSAPDVRAASDVVARELTAAYAALTKKRVAARRRRAP